MCDVSCNGVLCCTSTVLCRAVLCYNSIVPSCAVLCCTVTLVYCFASAPCYAVLCYVSTVLCCAAGTVLCCAAGTVLCCAEVCMPAQEQLLWRTSPLPVTLWETKSGRATSPSPAPMITALSMTLVPLASTTAPGRLLIHP